MNKPCVFCKKYVDASQAEVCGSCYRGNLNARKYAAAQTQERNKIKQEYDKKIAEHQTKVDKWWKDAGIERRSYFGCDNTMLDKLTDGVS